MPASTSVPTTSDLFEPDALDVLLNGHFAGRVVRKDLLHQVKKGTNVPSFVLEFLLARYCASDDPDEIAAGVQAVFETLERNYVRPDESNKAQSLVQQKGRHTFIDKVHVRYVEHEKRHWATMENFGSQRIAVAARYYEQHDRLLEGGIWAEVTLGYNDDEEERYAFYVEELRPIQLARFDVERFYDGRQAFTRDEWREVLLRSVGLEPSKLTPRQQMHMLARLIPLVEANYNFIELGPRGTGKSYFFSEFSPYSTLLSGGQATKAALFYNNARRKIGLVGYWDVVAFDEVAGITVRDPDAIQIMKDYMANGRFSRGVEVIADASMVFVGNLDESVEQLVHDPRRDLFLPLPPAFDLAVMDRFCAYLPGWEMPKTSSSFLTSRYGFITDYLAEAFHHLFKRSNRYEYVSKRIRLGRSVEGRDEKAIKKTVCGFVKLLHPSGDPTDAEFEEYVAYAVEARRRVKEQMNKRKPDDEFARINLSFARSAGEEVVVFCPESKDAPATQAPRGGHVPDEQQAEEPTAADPSEGADSVAQAGLPAEQSTPAAREMHYEIQHGATGYGYADVFGPYARGARTVWIEEPYLRNAHQIHNFVRFCELMVQSGSIRHIHLKAGFDHEATRDDLDYKLGEVQDALADHDVTLEIVFNQYLHDREVRFDNGWIVKVGRGLDYFLRSEGMFAIGAHDLSLRPCQKTKVDAYYDVRHDKQNGGQAAS